MDGDFRIDLDDLLKNVNTAEVITFYFPVLRKTILIDTRFTIDDPPMVRIVQMAGSLDERQRSLRKLRPQFSRPESITVVPWPKYVDSLVDLGVWSKVLERIAYSGHKEAVQQCDEVLREIRRLEKNELAAVISGENYHTVWARRG